MREREANLLGFSRKGTRRSAIFPAPRSAKSGGVSPCDGRAADGEVVEARQDEARPPPSRSSRRPSRRTPVRPWRVASWRCVRRSSPVKELAALLNRRAVSTPGLNDSVLGGGDGIAWEGVVEDCDISLVVGWRGLLPPPAGLRWRVEMTRWVHGSACPTVCTRAGQLLVTSPRDFAAAPRGAALAAGSCQPALTSAAASSKPLRADHWRRIRSSRVECKATSVARPILSRDSYRHRIRSGRVAGSYPVFSFGRLPVTGRGLPVYDGQLATSNSPMRRCFDFRHWRYD